MKGWISLHRQIMDHWLYTEKRVFSRYEAWLDIVMLASHEETTFVHGNDVVTVERGEFITSELKLMDRWGWSKSKVRSFLDVLQKDRMLDRKTDSKKTALKVHNYGVYQHFINHEKTEKDNTVDNTLDTQSINKQINKSTNKQKDNKEPSPPKSKIYGEESNYYQMADYFKIKVQEHAEVNKVAHLVANPNMQTWSDDFRKIVELDKRDTKELKAVIDFATKDAFWSTNILSPSTLRKQYVKLVAKLSSTSVSKPSGNYSTKAEKNKTTLQKHMEAARNEQRGNIELTSGDLFGISEF